MKIRVAAFALAFALPSRLLAQQPLADDEPGLHFNPPAAVPGEAAPAPPLAPPPAPPPPPPGDVPAGGDRIVAPPPLLATVVIDSQTDRVATVTLGPTTCPALPCRLRVPAGTLPVIATAGGRLGLFTHADIPPGGARLEFTSGSRARLIAGAIMVPMGAVVASMTAWSRQPMRWRTTAPTATSGAVLASTTPIAEPSRNGTAEAPGLAAASHAPRSLRVLPGSHATGGSAGPGSRGRSLHVTVWCASGPC